MSSATSAWRSPVVIPPWAVSRPKDVRAAKSSSKWRGFRSPVISAYRRTCSSVTVAVLRAIRPTSRSSFTEPRRTVSSIRGQLLALHAVHVEQPVVARELLARLDVPTRDRVRALEVVAVRIEGVVHELAVVPAEHVEARRLAVHVPVQPRTVGLGKPLELLDGDAPVDAGGELPDHGTRRDRVRREESDSLDRARCDDGGHAQHAATLFGLRSSPCEWSP